MPCHAMQQRRPPSYCTATIFPRIFMVDCQTINDFRAIDLSRPKSFNAPWSLRKILAKSNDFSARNVSLDPDFYMHQVALEVRIRQA
jgi:hypothetical protein